ncbi:MAG TPA: DUF899 domain-containing protein [Jiangellaceae bacterium]|nr:DUF899 domain-containing protein [Jiangellaceae bacterium]
MRSVIAPIRPTYGRSTRRQVAMLASKTAARRVKASAGRPMLESDSGVTLLRRRSEREGGSGPQARATLRGGIMRRRRRRRDHMTTHNVVKHDEWLKARRRHLAKEKEFTRLRDQLSRERRDLPWELVEKHYTFEGEHGRQSLSDLFERRGQLVIYHAMFNPDTAGADTSWTADAACFVCSFWMDNFNGITIHLNHRDITMAAVSRAPYPKLAAYKKRMGWGFPWLSSLGSDFNFDYRVSFTDDATHQVDYNYRRRQWGSTEAPGISVFVKDGGQIYHTYSTYERGLDMLNVAYHYMDLVPKGRDDGDGAAASWLRRRDEYQH